MKTGKSALDPNEYICSNVKKSYISMSIHTAVTISKPKEGYEKKKKKGTRSLLTPTPRHRTVTHIKNRRTNMAGFCC